MSDNNQIEIFDAGVPIEIGALISALTAANISFSTENDEPTATVAQRIFVSEADADRAGEIVLDYFENQGVETDDMPSEVAPEDDVLVAVFESVNPADIQFIKSMLQDAGIATRESKQGWAQAFGLALGAGGNIQLLVLGSKATEAARLIKGYSSELDSTSSTALDGTIE